MIESVAWDIYVVAARELKAHAALAQMIVKPAINDYGVHNMIAPAHAVLPYIVLSDITETPSRQFKSKRLVDELLINSYSAVLNTYEVLKMHKFISEALDARVFEVGTVRMLGVVSLIGTASDQDGKASRAITRFTVRAHE